MEDALLRTMLFDFFGELLTDKQREYFHLHYNEDMSLGEIAESEGISRQGVWDIIRRGEESLRRYEEKTGLVARFAARRETVAVMEERLARLLPLTKGEARQLTLELTERVRELDHGI